MMVWRSIAVPSHVYVTDHALFAIDLAMELGGMDPKRVGINVCYSLPTCQMLAVCQPLADSTRKSIPDQAQLSDMPQDLAL